MLAFVWAEDENGLIGKNGTLPWTLPNDLKFFKEITMDGTIVMGRKTFEGMNKRLLPGRQTIVLTRQTGYDGNGAEVLLDKETILQDAKEDDIYIIGGSDIFKLFLDDVDVLYQTKIHETFEGDTYFPKLDWDKFQLKKSVEGSLDENNTYPHTFSLFIRK
ncbi:dihydrofolate reductase [Granulicatella seriolae]|uniref:Dihydrofolate reductase n=1 Tax=Granulicatella seriolae TaxID=2967226 RepID=A0ABT1WKE7_9LACT|nr:dihydrofolate reductase [Granulicatella seriolae]